MLNAQLDGVCLCLCFSDLLGPGGHQNSKDNMVGFSVHSTLLVLHSVLPNVLPHPGDCGSPLMEKSP